MRGSAFAERLPEKATPRRERMILDAVRRRDIAPIVWDPIYVTHRSPSGKSYVARLWVSRDAVRIGNAQDSFRATVNHQTAQLIADHLGATLPTPKIAHEIWKQSILKIQAPTQPWRGEEMSSTSRMLDQTRQVDEKMAQERARVGSSGALMANMGKDWVTSSKLFRPHTPKGHCVKEPPYSANYGFYARGAPYRSDVDPSEPMYQAVGLCHGMRHTDYSQVVRLVRLDARVWGPGMGTGGRPGSRVIDVRRLATDPELAGLVNHDGVLPKMRHPSVSPICSAPCADDVSGSGPTESCAEGTVLGWDLKCHRPGDVSGPPLAQGTVVQQSSSYLPGNLDCEMCSAVDPPEPDPTGGPTDDGTPPGMAGMTAGTKLMMFGAGIALGYFASTRLLPNLQGS